MTQERKRKARPAGDEGALYTELVMASVKRRRLAKTPTWSADRLAKEMTAVGVPWTRDAVVNLETGRRKRLAAHELLALAYVLDVDSPAQLLVPDDLFQRPFPVTPNIMLTAHVAQAWCQGETGPLRDWLASARKGDPEDLAAMLADLPADVREQVITFARSAASAHQAGE